MRQIGGSVNDAATVYYTVKSEIIFKCECVANKRAMRAKNTKYVKRAGQSVNSVQSEQFRKVNLVKK